MCVTLCVCVTLCGSPCRLDRAEETENKLWYIRKFHCDHNNLLYFLLASFLLLIYATSEKQYFVWLHVHMYCIRLFSIPVVCV